jgi:hypothetical protein
VAWIARARKRAEHVRTNAITLGPKAIREQLLEADRELGRALRLVGVRLDSVEVEGYPPPEPLPAVIAAATRAHASIDAANRYLIDKNVEPAIASIHVARHHLALGYSHTFHVR